MNTALVAVIYIGSFDVQSAMIGPGTVMAALTYVVLILNGIPEQPAMILQIFARGLTSKRRLEEVLETKPAIRDGEDGETDGAVLKGKANGHCPAPCLLPPIRASRKMC